MRKKILVLGGGGSLGRRICRELAQDPAIECLVGERSPKTAVAIAEELNIGWRRLDLDSPDSVDNALHDIFAVVNAAGPATARTYFIPEQCARNAVHYVDLADERGYIKEFAKLRTQAERTGALLVSGASATPAISTALVESVVTDFDEVDEIRGYFSLGDRYPRGLALRTMLAHAGGSIRLRENGAWRSAFGWSESRVVRFPGQVGRRRLFLCDAPDLDIFPERFAARSVSFRAGMRSPALNFGVSVLGWGRKRGLIRDPARLADGVIKFGRVMPGQGDMSGALGITVRGAKEGRFRERNVFLMARDQNGAAILTSPAVALVRKWVHEGVHMAGATACVGLLSLADLKKELLPYDIVLVFN